MTVTSLQSFGPSGIQFDKQTLVEPHVNDNTDQVRLVGKKCLMRSGLVDIEWKSAKVNISFYCRKRT